MTIELKPVTSSNIAAIGHDGDILAIRYKNGSVYHHSGVTAEQYQSMIGRQSIGKAVHVFKTNNPGKLIK